jgi:hypothetical protein
MPRFHLADETIEAAEIAFSKPRSMWIGLLIASATIAAVFNARIIGLVMMRSMFECINAAAAAWACATPVSFIGVSVMPW